MDATTYFYSRDRATGEVRQDGSAVYFDDDLANSGWEKARRAGERWQAKDPANHTYEVFQGDQR